MKRNGEEGSVPQQGEEEKEAKMEGRRKEARGGEGGMDGDGIDQKEAMVAARGSQREKEGKHRQQWGM